jgi:predicted RNase H-like HicB family nuclease
MVVHEAEEGGFWAEVPALPGCVSQGDTMAEWLANISEAIQAWLEESLRRRRVTTAADEDEWSS